MSFFPKRLMPLTPKVDVPDLAGELRAADYNLVDEEIHAIQQTLLAGRKQMPSSTLNIVDPNSATDADEDALIATRSSANLLSLVARLNAKVDHLTQVGMLGTSGYSSTGKKVIFPEGSTVTFLTSAPTSTDTSISVNSTLGFADSGILTILNDVNVDPANPSYPTMVEWVSYSGKTSTQFLNCRRGVSGSEIVTHNGSYPGLSSSTNESGNVADYCVNLPSTQRSCSRRYPGWKFKAVYEFPLIAFVGSWVELIRSFKRSAGSLILTAGALGAQGYADFVAIATDLGVLAVAGDGSQYLLSADIATPEGQLNWEEGEAFVVELMDAGYVSLVQEPDSFVVPKLAIPVFGGRMSVQNYLAALTNNGLGETRQEIIVQTADSRLYVNALQVATTAAPIVPTSTTTTTVPNPSKIYDLGAGSIRTGNNSGGADVGQSFTYTNSSAVESFIRSSIRQPFKTARSAKLLSLRFGVGRIKGLIATGVGRLEVTIPGTTFVGYLDVEDIPQFTTEDTTISIETFRQEMTSNAIIPAGDHFVKFSLIDVVPALQNANGGLREGMQFAEAIPSFQGGRRQEDVSGSVANNYPWTAHKTIWIRLEFDIPPFADIIESTTPDDDVVPSLTPKIVQSVVGYQGFYVETPRV